MSQTKASDLASTDRYYLYLAYLEALKALSIDEVPVGAVIACNNKVIATGFNQKELLQDPLKHAEIIAIQEAAKNKDSWRLSDCTLYTTLEPCYMCASVILQARIGRVVYAAKDPKGGGESCLQLFSEQQFNHQPKFDYIEIKEYSALLSDYFKHKRIKSPL